MNAATRVLLCFLLLASPGLRVGLRQANRRTRRRRLDGIHGSQRGETDGGAAGWSGSDSRRRGEAMQVARFQDHMGADQGRVPGRGRCWLCRWPLRIALTTWEKRKDGTWKVVSDIDSPVPPAQ